MAGRQVIVIGAGVGGLEAARAAAGAGARVTLVSNQPAGGRGVWNSLLPSKVLLTAAGGLGHAERLSRLGLHKVAGAPDPAAAVARIAELSRSWSCLQAAGLERSGVRFVEGRASFAEPHRVTVDAGGGSAESFDADAFVVATGSVPVFPPALKPDGGRILAPRLVSKLGRLPASVVVIGAGATGAEFAYGFNRLGVAVTWVVDEFGVLPAFDREAAAVLVEALERRGVVRHEGVAARAAAAGEDGVAVTLADGRDLVADMAFIALGRRPDAADLRLERAGLTPGASGGIEVDEDCRTAVPHVYAAGDATGTPFIANKAMAQGWVAGRHAAGATAPAYRPETTVEAVYTEPEVAQVGRKDAGPTRGGHGVRVLRLPNASNLKAVLSDETGGFVKLVSDAATGVVLGASAVGAHAGDVLAPLALGIRLGARVDDLAASFAAHPGFAESVYDAARQG